MSYKQKINLLESYTLPDSYLNILPGGNREKNGKYCIDQILTLSPCFSSLRHFPGDAKRDSLAEIITFNKEAQSGNSKSHALVS